MVGSAVESDPELVGQAEAAVREGEGGVQFQTAPSDDLPYRDEVFDIVVGQIGLATGGDPEAAVSELVRVTKPGGFVVLVQLVWKAPVPEDRQSVLSAHLGARPRMVVEWKRILRECGVLEVHVEDWSDGGTAFRPKVAKPFPDFAELFTVWERFAILRRAWGRWGWRGVRAAVARESEVHRLLTNERILGLNLMRGRKEGAPAHPVGTQDEMQGPGPEPATSHDESREVSPSESSDETLGLPLFGTKEESGNNE